MRDKTKFSYFISEKNSIGIVNFDGEITKNAGSQIEECQNKLITPTLQLVIFNFQNVPYVELMAIPYIAKLQKKIRDNSIALYFCSMNENVSRLFEQKSIVRNEEIAKNLADAIRKLPSNIGKVA